MPKVKKLLGITISGAKRLIKPAALAVAEIVARRVAGLSIQEIHEVFDDANLPTSEQESGKSAMDDISSLVEKCADVLLKEHESTRQAIQTFKTNLGKLVAHLGSLSTIKLPIFVLIDEVDRCRPTYAVELLESIKHLFNVDGVYFVIATNSSQLRFSVGALYGHGFDSGRYIQRFFDQEYDLPAPDNDRFAQYLFRTQQLLNYPRFVPALLHDVHGDVDRGVFWFSRFATYFRLSLRDQKMIAGALSAICFTWTDAKNIYLPYLLFLLCLRHRSKEKYDRLLYSDAGRDHSRFVEELSDVVDSRVQIRWSQQPGTNLRPHDNSGTVKVALTEVIWTYFSDRDVDLHELRKSNLNKYQFPKGTLLSPIADELPQNSRDNVKPSISKYPRLVSQAGQLVSGGSQTSAETLSSGELP